VVNSGPLWSNPVLILTAACQRAMGSNGQFKLADFGVSGHSLHDDEEEHLCGHPILDGS